MVDWMNPVKETLRILRVVIDIIIAIQAHQPVALMLKTLLGSDWEESLPGRSTKRRDKMIWLSCLRSPWTQLDQSVARKGWVRRRAVQGAPRHLKEVHRNISLGREASGLGQIWRCSQEAICSQEKVSNLQANDDILESGMSTVRQSVWIFLCLARLLLMLAHRAHDPHPALA